MPHPQSDDTDAHSPLEISRATAGARAGAEAARFPQVHSASLLIYSCPQNRGNLKPVDGHDVLTVDEASETITLNRDLLRTQFGLTADGT